MAINNRKRKLDESKKREICAIVAVGASRSTAARYVGCSVATIRRETHLDADFRERLLHHEALHEISQLKNIHTASHDNKNWRAAAWTLERIYPDRYQSRPPQTVSREQMINAMWELGRIIAEEVPDPSCKKAIWARLRNLGDTGTRKPKVRSKKIPTIPAPNIAQKNS